MSRATVLAAGQRFAAAGMVDACAIRRESGHSTDSSTGIRTPAYTALYAGKCRVQQSLTRAAEHDAGEDYLLLLRLEVQLPMSVAGLQVNDQVTITASVNDPDLVGRVFLIRDLFHKTEPTARRVGVIERTAV
jgi:hypothetical protein